MKRYETLLRGLSVLLLTGCTTVGTGHRTLIRAGCDDFAPSDTASPEQKKQGLEQELLCDEVAKLYPHLIAPTGTDNEKRILRIDPDGRPIDPAIQQAETKEQPSYQSFLSFLKLKYGSEGFQPVLLSFTAHDRTNTPPFLPIDPRPNPDFSPRVSPR